MEWKSKADWRNNNWKYTSAAATDVSKTIARVKKEMKDLAEQRKEKPKVLQIRKAK